MASILDALEQNLEKAKTDKQSEETSGGSGRKFAVGLLLIGRLVPYMNAAGNPRFMDVMYHHYYTGIDSKWHFLYCPKNGGWDEACQFCDAMKSHYDEFGSDTVYNNFKRKRKYKVNFFVASVSKLTGFNVDDAVIKSWQEVIGQVVQLDLPYSLKEKIDVALENPELGTKIYNPINGYDFQIRVTEKKTDDGSYPNYDTSDFGRKLYPLIEDATREKLEELLGSAVDLQVVIKKSVERDQPKIGPAAVEEGFGAAETQTTTSSPGGGRMESILPPKTSEPTPPVSGGTSTPSEVPPENKEEVKTESSAQDTLAAIFARYGNDK